MSVCLSARLSDLFIRHMALRVETDTKEEVHILRAAAENDYEVR